MIQSNSEDFILIKGFNGFGWMIRDCRTRPYKVIFHTSNKEQALEVFETIEENHTDLPEPITNWTPQFLRIVGKNEDSVFLVLDPDQVDRIAFAYFKRDLSSSYNRFTKWGTYGYEVLPDEYIDACPSENRRLQLRSDNEKTKERIEDNKKHDQYIDAIEKMVESGDPKGAYHLLHCIRDYHFDYISLDEFGNEYIKEFA